MDPTTPLVVGRNTIITSATTGVLAGTYGLVKGSSQIGPLMVSAAINGGIAGATFFSFREYIASPVFLSLLSETTYSWRIRELQNSRQAGGRSGEKLTWWDMRMYKVPDTAVSGAFTGAVLNAWKRGRPGILPGVTTGGLVCTLLQLAYNELDIARIKYVSRVTQTSQTPPRTERTAVSQTTPPPPLPDVDTEPRKPLLERILVTLGFHQVSDEEFLAKLKFKREFALRRIAELEKEREIERSKSESESSSSS